MILWGLSSSRNLWFCCVDGLPFVGSPFSSALIGSLCWHCFSLGLYSWEETHNPKWFWNLHWRLLGTAQASVSVYLDGNQMPAEEDVHINELYGADCMLGSSASTFWDESLTFGFNFSSAEQSKAMPVGKRNSIFLCSSNQSTWKSQRPNISEITNANKLTFALKIFIFQNLLVFSLALSRKLISILRTVQLDQLPLFLSFSHVLVDYCSCSRLLC